MRIEQNAPEPNRGVRVAVVFEAGVVLLALVFGWLLARPPFRQLDITPGASVWGVLATGPLLLAMWLCARSQLRPLRSLMREVEELLAPLFVNASPVHLAMVSVLAGLGEEGLFRGVIQMEVSAWLGPVVGLVIASTAFGLAHFVTPTYAVLAGLVGVYLGWLTMVTGNILVPIIVHALYDFLALAYLVRTGRTRELRERVRSNGPQG